MLVDRQDRVAEIEELHQRFSDLPVEALVKDDLLRLGVSFSPAALEMCASAKPKSYFIFSFDHSPIDAMEQQENLRAPEELRLFGGRFSLRPTVVSVRIHPGSPYKVDVRAGDLVVLNKGETVARVELQPPPSYYSRALASGRPMTEVAPTIQWGYLIYLTVYRKCQYFGFKEECQFCDINANYRQQRSAGRPYVTVKAIEDVLEALAVIDEEDVDRRTQAYTITGGSITAHLHGQDEAAFYGSYARAINERFPGRWISKLVVQALPRERLLEFRDAGVQIYHPNYEVWDPALFRAICPGKERYVGRDEWIRRILEAGEVFGPSQVIPNFVAGVELARPHGFADVESALASTGEGLEFFMSRGIVPRFTVWCPEPLSLLGRDQGPAPLAYHAGLLRIYRETLLRHRLPAPPGYGPPGAGRAVFSVSSFMDVLPEDLQPARLPRTGIVEPSGQLPAA